MTGIYPEELSPMCSRDKLKQRHYWGTVHRNVFTVYCKQCTVNFKLFLPVALLVLY